MKKTNTNTITTNTKAKDIIRFCNVLLEPAEQYMGWNTPKAEVDEKGNLTFDFIMAMPDYPFPAAPAAFPMVTFNICNINDIEDPEDLYWAVNETLMMPDDINETMAYFKKDLNMSDKAVAEDISDLAEVLPQVEGEFYNAAFIYPEEEDISFAETPWYL